MSLASTSAAAWAQALLSTVAILAAAWITNHDRKETRRLQLGDTRSALGALMWEVHKAVSSAAENASNAESWRVFTAKYAPDRLQRTVEALAASPLYELGDWSLVNAAVELRELGFRLLQIVQKRGRVPSTNILTELVDMAAQSRTAMACVAVALHEGPVDPPLMGRDLVDALGVSARRRR